MQFLKKIIFLALLLLSGAALANPILGGAAEPQTEATAISAQLLHWQSEINSGLNKITAALHDDASPAVLWAAIMLSFAYGVLHALGPGHAKTIIASYMLTHKARWTDGIKISLRFALTHVVGAFVIALALYILQRSVLSIGQETVIINVLCWGIIAIIGLSLIYRGLTGKSVLPHDHDGECGHSHANGSAENHAHNHRTGNIVAMTAGLLPCPGPILVLLYALTVDMLAIGALLAFIMAMGMAVTIAAIAIISIYSRAGVMHLSAGKRNAALYAQRLLIFIGGSLILAFASWQLYYQTL